MSANSTDCSSLTEGVGTCYAEGFIAAALAVVCFGSNFVPVKKFNTGDGMFFQWVVCTGIFIFGLGVQLVRGIQSFYPLAMLGGFFWATGNVMVVPIVKMIGLGLGLLLWGTANLIMGWASGNFGLFGIGKQEVKRESLNYVGVVFAIVTVAIFAFVKPENNKHKEETSYGKINTEEDEMFDTTSSSHEAVQDKIWVDDLTETQKRVLGVLGSIVSGILYGVNFDPPQYLIEHHEGSPYSIDYAFSHFCGIFMTSTAYFIIYCAVMKNKPRVFPEAILPGFVSGVMWATAQCAWFIANSKLLFVIAFPIISTGPGFVGALWGIFLFKEIRDKKNLAVLCLAFLVELLAIGLITASNL